MPGLLKTAFFLTVLLWALPPRALFPQTPVSSYEPAAHSRTNLKPEEAFRLLERGGITLDEKILITARDYFEARANTTTAYENDCRLARAYFGLSVMNKLGKNKKQGSKNLDRAVRWARAAVQINENSAEAHTLLADLYGEKIVAYGGAFAGMKYGPKVKSENEKALAISPRDPAALAGLGRQYLLAPKAFGGDVHKAVDCFKRSLALDPKSDSTFVWLARAYRKLKDRPAFKDALANALRLQPGNTQARWELSQWPDEKN